MSDNPFSLLDFLGYFFPGATVLMALYHYTSVVNDMFDIEDEASVMMYVVCIIAAYVLGHVVALVSSLTVEKYANWKYGYPSQYLLKSYSRGRFFRDRPMNNPSINAKSKQWFFFWKTVMKLFVLVLLVPITICDCALSKLLGIDYYYTRRLPGEQVSMIRAKSVNLYKALNIYSASRPVFQNDSHRIIHNYYYEKADGHSKRMDNCIAVYDFLRAMSLVFVVLFFVALFKGIRSIDPECPPDWTSISLIVGFFFMSYLCFMGFMKFYRKFSVENFMCLICDGDLSIVNTTQHDNNLTTGVPAQQEGNDVTVE